MTADDLHMTSAVCGETRRNRLTEIAAEALTAVTWIYLVTAVVPLSAYLAPDHRRILPDEPAETLVAKLLHRGASHYLTIANYGYSYAPDTKSNVAFFPAYPLAGRAVSWASGWPMGLSLLFVAHTALIGAFVLFAAYLRARAGGQRRDWCEYALLAMALWPTTVFFRLGYSESMFLVTAVGAMYAMEQNVHPLWVALLVGLGTATRPVGTALVPPFALYLWQRSKTATISCDTSSELACAKRTQPMYSFVRKAAILLPLACWGLGAYMLYQYLAFGEPLAFA